MKILCGKCSGYGKVRGMGFAWEDCLDCETTGSVERGSALEKAKKTKKKEGFKNGEKES